MDDLMIKVADRILSYDGKDCIEVTKTNAGSCLDPKPEHSIKANSFVEQPEPSSVSLLRESIIHSIKKRTSEVEKSSLQKYHRPQDCCLKSPQIKVQFINNNESHFEFPSSLSPITNEGSNSSTDEKAFISDTKQANFSDSDEGLFSKKHNELNCAPQTEDMLKKNKIETQASENENKIGARPFVGENGLKLARRSSPEKIFENCSTYNINCPTMVFEKNKEDKKSTKELFTEKNKVFCSKKGITDLNFQKAKESSSDVEFKAFDDQISLGESFFAGVINADYASPVEHSIFGPKFSDVKRKLSINTAKKENDYSNSSWMTNDRQNDYRSQADSEFVSQKSSKKVRKRNRKNRSQSVPVYDCPKCGASYTTTSKLANDVARCLHCDFWISVEPLFVKTEKQAWNTCRIC